jgi:hypothetical protein
MSDSRDVIAHHLPKHIVDGNITVNTKRADKIINDLEDNGYCLVRAEVMAVLKTAIEMLAGADKMTPDDRQRIADSALSTVWGGFYPTDWKKF